MAKYEPIITNFYILYPKNTELDCENAENKLGYIITNKVIQSNYKMYNEFTFHANDGFKILCNIIKLRPEKIDSLRIIADNSKKYSVNRFLNILNNCKIK